MNSIPGWLIPPPGIVPPYDSTIEALDIEIRLQEILPQA
jgi:hypothetical protein